MVYVDLLLYSEENVLSMDELLKRHSSNLNYFKFLPAGFSCKVIQHAGFSDRAEINGVTYQIIKAKNKKWKIPFSLFRSLRAEKPGVILFHSMIYAVQVIFLKLILGKKVKIIVQNHAEKPRKGINGAIQRLADYFISAYFFVSNEQARPWLDGGIIKSPDKIYEVMEGSTVFRLKDKFRAKSEFKLGDKTLFIWVGRLDANKDPLTVLKGFDAFAKQHGNIKLWMIYSTTELLAEVQDFIRENDLSNFVELIGRVEHSKLENYYNAADYFILGSHYEGSGYALCEAMACGCVPVVTAIPSFKAMLNNGECGYLFEPGDSSDLYEKLMNLNLEDRSGLGKKVLEKFDRDLSFKAIGNKISEVTLKLVSK